MIKKDKSDRLPTPSLEYQGAGICLTEVDLKIGSFSVPSYPRIGFGHAVGREKGEGGVPRLIIRPASLPQEPDDPCTNYFIMGYDQNAVEWDMVFSVITDPKGGLVGTSFSVDVDSSYPQTPMSIAKVLINQPKLSIMVRNVLPADYFAQIVTRFWANGRNDLPLDAWFLFQVAYVKPEGLGRDFARLEDVPIVPVGEFVLFPAHQGSKGGVLGDNYPSQVSRSK